MPGNAPPCCLRIVQELHGAIFGHDGVGSIHCHRGGLCHGSGFGNDVVPMPDEKKETVTEKEKFQIEKEEIEGGN